jgi:hypothetical protein
MTEDELFDDVKCWKARADKATREITRLRGYLEEIATFTSDPVAAHAAREALSSQDST